jgi:hypothetical protein
VFLPGCARILRIFIWPRAGASRASWNIAGYTAFGARQLSSHKQAGLLSRNADPIPNIRRNRSLVLALAPEKSRHVGNKNAGACDHAGVPGFPAGPFYKPIHMRAAAAKGPIQGIRKRRRTIIAVPARIPAAQGRVISETAISSGHQQCEAASKRPGCSSQPGLFLLGRI